MAPLRKTDIAVGDVVMNWLLSLIWSRFKRKFLALHHEDLCRESKYAMEWAHTDSKGRTYMRFTKGDLPLERVGKMQDYMDLMSSGLSESELDELVTVADNELALAFAGKKANMSKVGWVFTEIRDRRKMVLHGELLYNFLAVQYIRDDEPVNEFVEWIHREKVEQFKEDNKNSSTYFFFQVPELKLVNDFLKFTETEWNEHWQNCQRQQEQMKKKIALLPSVQGFSKGIKTPARTA